MSRAENILYFAAAAMKYESILLVSLHFWTKLVLLWRACYHTTGACIVLFWGAFHYSLSSDGTAAGKCCKMIHNYFFFCEVIAVPGMTSKPLLLQATRLFFENFKRTQGQKNSSKSFKNSIICQLKTNFLLKKVPKLINFAQKFAQT